MRTDMMGRTEADPDFGYIGPSPSEEARIEARPLPTPPERNYSIHGAYTPPHELTERHVRRRQVRAWAFGFASGCVVLLVLFGIHLAAHS